MTYKFEQFKVEITDPTISVISVNDNLNAKTCSIEILLTTDSASFGISLDGFAYIDTWEDADVQNWVTNKLTEYEL